MTATELRANLLQQIQQADEKLLRVISSVLEAVKVEYANELTEPVTEEDLLHLRTPEMSADEYEAALKPMSREALLARAEASNADIVAGRIYSVDQMDKMFGL
ncbi:hypothetical protein QWY85_17555 [Neolewinella lacunae]|uniref:Uncharacterized protein n=1 Tax=Neolewinella lacunae TaxID=1517758 RepID=A0A923T8N8_9BACT|nr:hypothetical protein [Neolewinella lacunae]MBC6995830.1 hypothetical protein [Neolewinella lacunae]MDN3636477.1 hypothetical protein [Neolewinella lacunae]